MSKQIVIKVPDWVNEKDVRDVIEKYIESRLADSATREEYLEFLEINVDEIVEYPINEELEILKKSREKAKERCQF